MKFAWVGMATLLIVSHTLFMTVVGLMWDHFQGQETGLWSRLTQWGATYYATELAHVALIFASYFFLMARPGQQTTDRPSDDRPSDDRLIGWHGTTRVVLDLKKVSWFEASAGQAKAHLESKTYWVRKSLKALEASLPSEAFVRIHRSSIVNVSRVDEIDRWFHGDMRLRLLGGGELNVSRRYRDRLLEVLGDAT